MRIIALINQKGGTGKTTSTINIGAGLNKLGKKVMLIDLDPQAHLTYSMGIEGHKLDYTVFELLKGEIDSKGVIINKNGIDIIPASIELSGAELELSGVPGREFLLKENLNCNDYDYILIDCPPSLSLLTLNALTTAKELFIPLQTEYLAMQGLAKLLETVEVVKKRLNNELEITGIIATRYDSRRNLNREVVDKIREHFGNKLFKTFIRENIALAEAPSYESDIFTYKAGSNGAEDYMELSKEIINLN